MFLEVFIYLVIAFGILVLCITMLEKDGIIDEKYVVIKSEKTKITVTVDIEGLDEQDTRRLYWIIRKGKYNDIYDVADEYITIESSVEDNKK